MLAARRLVVALLVAPLGACAVGRSLVHGDAYLLPLPAASFKDTRPSADPAVAPTPSDEPLIAHERHDLVYAPRIASGDVGLLDVFTPDDTAPATSRAAVITLHGGAWRRGDKQQVRDISRRFAREGIVAFAVNYSLAPRARWPGQLEDTQAALRWIRANAAVYGVDPVRVFAWGGSAGGHLATMLALRDDPLGAREPFHGRVRGAIDAYGDADLSIEGGMAPDEDGILADFLGAPRAGLAAERLADASTTTYVRPDAAVLILHGTADFSVSIWHSEHLAAALAACGADVSYLRVPGGGHGRSTHEAPEAWRATLRFIERH